MPDTPVVKAAGRGRRPARALLRDGRSYARAVSIRFQAGLNPNRDISYYANLAGQLIAVPGYTHTRIYRCGTTDHHLYHLIQMLPKSGVFIDVGANVGEFTVAASAVAPFGHIYSIEPCTLVQPFLELNVRQNGLSNVTIDRHALSDRRGNAVLTFQSQTSASVTATQANAVGRTRIDVPAIPGDDLIASAHIERVDLVKIDVEGAESRVLSGFAELLARQRPLLVIEMDGHAQETGAGEEEVVELLSLSDYMVAEFGTDVRRVRIATLTSPRSAKSRRHNPNVLAIPRERLPAVRDLSDVSLKADRLWPQEPLT